MIADKPGGGAREEKRWLAETLASIFRMPDVLACGVRLGVFFGRWPWPAAWLSRQVGGGSTGPEVAPSVSSGSFRLVSRMAGLAGG
jgi:hypothetical protein